MEWWGSFANVCFHFKETHLSRRVGLAFEGGKTSIFLKKSQNAQTWKKACSVAHQLCASVTLNTTMLDITF